MQRPHRHCLFFQRTPSARRQDRPSRRWLGLAFYEGRATRVFLDPTPACHSPLARFLGEHPIKTLLAVGHIRRRTRGPTTLANTHPFVRELWGRHWVFAHNGTLPRVRRHKLGRFNPIGNTDSEHAFCVLLEGLRKRFPAYPTRRRELWEAVAEIGGQPRRRRDLQLPARRRPAPSTRCATKLSYIIRKAPFGLAALADDDVRIDFSTVTTPRDRVAVIATCPLTTNEEWTLGKPGELWVFDSGTLRATIPSTIEASRSARRASLSAQKAT